MLSAALLALLLQISDYTQLTSVGVAANLKAKANLTLGASVFNPCVNDPAIPLDGDLWFEPWPSQTYKVTVWYADGTTDQVDVDGASSPAGLSAVYLGETGEDRVGQDNQNSANGTIDRHIQLRGLATTPARVQIIGAPSGLWETPFNGANWIVAMTYGKRATYIEHCHSRALAEMTKDTLVRYAAFFGELVVGKIRSKTKLNERLKFYQLELWPTGAPGITLP